jgi:hypothetical protein
MISYKQVEIRFLIQGRSGITYRRYRGRKMIRQRNKRKRILFLVRIVHHLLVRRTMQLLGRRVNHRIWRKRFNIFRKKDSCKFQKRYRSQSRISNRFCCIASMMGLILGQNMRRKLQQNRLGCLTSLER